MNHEPNVIPGFADRPQRGSAGKRLVLLRALVVLLPLAALLAIDATGRFVFLRPVLLLLPLLDLRNQAVIWYRHVRRFGFPPISHCRKMLYLDTLRGYDARSNKVRLGSRFHVGIFVGASLLLAVACWAVWRLTGLSAALYPGVFMLVLAAKAVVRRARPPAVLFLAASSLTASRILLRVMQTAHPFNVVACLHHEPMGPLLDDVLGFFSFRTGDDSVWREMVSSLVAVSPLVVLDVRKATLPVEYEIDESVKTVQREQLFFVGDEPEHPAVPRDRCFAEGPLVEALHALLWGSAPSPAVAAVQRADPSVGARWSDRRNGYFAWTPPAKWTVREFDDARTKVQFIHPTAPAIFVRLIVKEAAGAGHAPPTDALRRARRMGVQCRVTESILLGVLCSEVRMTLPNHEESAMWLFAKGGLHFNVQFSAPSLAAFKAHYDTVHRALETIVVVKEPGHDAGKVQSQRLAQRLRYARLAAEEISVDEAQRALAEARSEFATDREAVAAIDRVLTELAQARAGKQRL
jgi:hypothetical protein